jgi:hypothetical protein
MKFLALFGAKRSAMLLCLMGFVLGATLVGCGGGDTSSQAGVGSGGTGSYTSGPVSGYGSIIVNGIRYDDTQATVTDDEGHARTRSDVKLGMTTHVRGSAVSNAQATAQSVQYGSELLGPIDGAPGATSITVLGQTVKITAKTFFSDDLPTGLASLVAGNVVEVYGLPDGQGNITATRIELKAVDGVSYAGSYKLRGIVSYADTSTRLCAIGAATVSYSSEAQQTPITVGALVSMRLNKAQSGSNWVATSIKSGTSGVADSQQAHIEGVISKVADATHFVVNGLTFEASSAVQSAAGGSLAVGVRVEVQGAVTAGVLVASSVRIDVEDGSEDIELHGTVSSLNMSAYTFIVRGTVVSYTGITPHGGVLSDGACVEVQGSQIVNGSQLQAGEIEVHDASDCH